MTETIFATGSTVWDTVQENNVEKCNECRTDLVRIRRNPISVLEKIRAALFDEEYHINNVAYVRKFEGGEAGAICDSCFKRRLEDR